MHRRTLLQASPWALLHGGALSALCVGRAVSAQPGPSETTQDLSWTDERRQRQLPLRLRMPAGTGAVPLVLFSHGLGGTVDAGTRWAQAWAVAGVATLHLQHPGSDTPALRQGRLQQAASGEQLINRAMDVRFVLDELARRREGPWARLRLDAIGVAGHSFGALTTLAVAGRLYESPRRRLREREAGELRLDDPRPRAFAAFSPSPGNAQLGPEGISAIRRPMLCLTGSLDGDPLGDVRTGHYRRQVYDHLPAGDKAELWLDGADHMTFGGHLRGPDDGAGRGGRLTRREPAAVAQAARHEALIMQTSTLWWRAQLLDDADARRQLAGGPSGLLAEDAWRRG